MGGDDYPKSTIDIYAVIFSLMFSSVYSSINSLINSGRGSSSVCRLSRLIVITISKHKRTSLFLYIFHHLIKEVTSQNKLYLYTSFWKYQTILMYNLPINRLYGNGAPQGLLTKGCGLPHSVILYCTIIQCSVIMAAGHQNCNHTLPLVR